MITLRMESQQFVALHTGFNAAASDPDAPIDPTLITGVQSALAEAKATALPGLPVLVTLQSHNELNALAAYFEVGGEGHPDVTDNQWYSLVALIEQATQQLAN
jgi:NADP-dependent 3-hydroxy acid dehydrogenase YdfG